GDRVVRSRLGQIMIVLPETDKRGAAVVCQRLRKSIEMHPIRCAGKRLDLKVEFGVATYPENGNTPEALTEYADDKIIEGHSVLIVDDHPQIVSILKRRIEARGGFKCVSAPDGEAALEMILKDPPDLIITDVMMPKMSGYELIGRLKENPVTRDIPVIVLTAHNVKLDRMKSIYPGSVPVISKTDGFDKLIDLVDTLI
ncbi:MAG: response regulator, partial [Candidatus Omnitrophica bacterium]|nr:response regulator [Candidatus Omnitrophota bacterium]